VRTKVKNKENLREF